MRISNMGRFKIYITFIYIHIYIIYYSTCIIPFTVVNIDDANKIYGMKTVGR